MASRIDFAALMPDVARALLGDPNARLSNPHEWRYRTHGSLAVHVGGPHAGTFRDHEADAGGGVLDLVKREAGARDNREAMAWLRDAGLLDGAGGYLADNELTGRDSPSKGRYRADSAPAPSSKPPRKPPESRCERISTPDPGRGGCPSPARARPVGGYVTARRFTRSRLPGRAVGMATCRDRPEPAGVRAMAGP